MNNENLSVRLTKASAIEMKPINWIWNGWLASGKFHVLGGMAGTGKSTIAMSICAAISSGGLFPDGQRAEQGDVVIWTGEDDPQDTLAPSPDGQFKFPHLWPVKLPHGGTARL